VIVWGTSGNRRAWWLSEFVSVKINGLGNFMEQSKLYMMTVLDRLNLAGKIQCWPWLYI